MKTSYIDRIHCTCTYTYDTSRDQPIMFLCLLCHSVYNYKFSPTLLCLCERLVHCKNSGVIMTPKCR